MAPSDAGRRAAGPPRSRFTIVRLLVAAGVLTVLGFLFVRSVRDTRSAAYTVNPSDLSNWAVVLERSPNPGDPRLALQPPPGLAADLFRQVFTRTMESLSTPNPPGIPLVLQGEFDRAFAGRVSADALVAAARDAGLESIAWKPRCLGYRRVSEPGATRQLYFVVFDAPEFAAFRSRIAGLRGGDASSADFDPAALSPVLVVAGSDRQFGRWFPLHPDPQADCFALIEPEGGPAS